MTEFDRVRMRDRVKTAEGKSLLLYRDSRGYWTIGYGRLLEPYKGGGISEDEADYLLANDLRKAERACEDLPTFRDLSSPRQAVLIEMCFNLGADGLKKFSRMFLALADHDYVTAAKEMLASTWSTQVGSRATRLAEQMRTGQLA